MENPFTNPFPGMNPYLETRGLWPEVHNSLIAAMKSFLRQRLPFKYSVIMEERVAIGQNPAEEPPARYARPDLTISSQEAPRISGAHPDSEDTRAVTVVLPEIYTVREWFIEIREQSRGKPVTILEVLSPTNKNPGAGREQYLDKRQRILESATHMVEIDLVRVGRPMPLEGYDGDAPYRNLVSRWQDRPAAALYPFRLQSVIPDITVPLLDDDAEPTLPLGEMVHDLYLQDYYCNYVDYGADPAGPLSDNDREWLDKILREQGFRS